MLESPVPFELQVTRPGSYRLVHSRVTASFTTLFALLFVVLWYWFLLGRPVGLAGALDSLRTKVAGDVVMWLFALAPVLLVPPLYRVARTALRGRRYEFDTSSGVISYNGKEVARYGEVTNLQLHTIRGKRGQDKHLLTILLHRGDALDLCQSHDEELVISVADTLADLFDVRVVRD